SRNSDTSIGRIDPLASSLEPERTWAIRSRSSSGRGSGLSSQSLTYPPSPLGAAAMQRLSGLKTIDMMIQLWGSGGVIGWPGVASQTWAKAWSSNNTGVGPLLLSTNRLSGLNRAE